MFFLFGKTYTIKFIKHMCYIIKSMTFSFKSKIIQIYKKKDGILYKWFRKTWLLFSMEWQHKEHIYNIKASYKFIDNHIVKSFIQFPLKIISNVFWPFFSHWVNYYHSNFVESIYIQIVFHSWAHKWLDEKLWNCFDVWQFTSTMHVI